MLRIHNTMTGQDEAFLPIAAGRVGMYVCGPTVYDYFHIGNARSFVAFDVMRRYLAFSGFEVTYVQNLTDIDDKIIARANADGVPASEVAESFSKAYYQDLPRLGILPATHHPRATEYVERIVTFIERILASGCAYRTGTGVYFEASRFPTYGKLSGRSLDDLRAGARVEIDEEKRSPADFAIWKAAKPGEPVWKAPFGDGRPGWHIECSVMATDLLGPSFDIHGGGQDLIFPHHENERAQSMAATGQQDEFVRTWVHNAFLNMDSEKMSKSLGNFRTAREVCDAYGGEAVRLFLISGHHRKPLDFSDAKLAEAKGQVARFRDFFDAAEAAITGSPADAAVDKQALATLTPRHETADRRFREAMDDDCNTPAALSVLHDLVSQGHEWLKGTDGALRRHGAERLVSQIRDLGTRALGLFAESDRGKLSDEETAWLSERLAARARKDFPAADALRGKLAERGVTVSDTPWGPVWRRK